MGMTRSESKIPTEKDIADMERTLSEARATVARLETTIRACRSLRESDAVRASAECDACLNDYHCPSHCGDGCGHRLPIDVIGYDD